MSEEITVMCCAAPEGRVSQSDLCMKSCPVLDCSGTAAERAKLPVPLMNSYMDTGTQAAPQFPGNRSPHSGLSGGQSVFTHKMLSLKLNKANFRTPFEVEDI